MITDKFLHDLRSNRCINMHYYEKRDELALDLFDKGRRTSVCYNLNKEEAILIRDRLNEYINHNQVEETNIR